MSLASPQPGDSHRLGRSWTASSPVDVTAWSRNTEKLRTDIPRSRFIATETFLVVSTYSSFRLDGISVLLTDVTQSISRRNTHRSFRSRTGQRFRNHAAIVRCIERMLASNKPLKPDTLLGWYASVSCGLSTTMPAGEKMRRIETVVRQINSPHLRLAPAITEIAELHQALLADELVPSFNGILARLLLHFHLGRCGLLPILFDPSQDSSTLFQHTPTGLRRLMQLIDEAYARR
jgi:hypothetical protein